MKLAHASSAALAPTSAFQLAHNLHLAQSQQQSSGMQSQQQQQQQLLSSPPVIKTERVSGEGSNARAYTHSNVRSSCRALHHNSLRIRRAFVAALPKPGPKTAAGSTGSTLLPTPAVSTPPTHPSITELQRAVSSSVRALDTINPRGADEVLLFGIKSTGKSTAVCAVAKSLMPAAASDISADMPLLPVLGSPAFLEQHVRCEVEPSYLCADTDALYSDQQPLQSYERLDHKDPSRDPDENSRNPYLSAMLPTRLNGDCTKSEVRVKFQVGITRITLRLYVKPYERVREVLKSCWELVQDEGHDRSDAHAAEARDALR